MLDVLKSFFKTNEAIYFLGGMFVLIPYIALLCFGAYFGKYLYIIALLWLVIFLPFMAVFLPWYISYKKINK